MDAPVWTTNEDFEAARAAESACLIFKHSTRCPVSTEAHRQVERFLQSQPGANVAVVLVVENRPVSLAIAAALDVQHASPQAILLRDGEATWNASHWDITVESLETAWATTEANASE